MKQSGRTLLDTGHIPVGCFANFQRKILQTVFRADKGDGISSILQSGCETLMCLTDCHQAVAGDFDIDEGQFRLLAHSSEDQLFGSSGWPPVAEELQKVFQGKVEEFVAPAELAVPVGISTSCRTVWPVRDGLDLQGFIGVETDLSCLAATGHLETVELVAGELSLGLAVWGSGFCLQQEKAFSREVTDTIQALVVTIAACGTILSFNGRAEEVSGYREQDILGCYWVDVLLNPKDRRRFQRLFS